MALEFHVYNNHCTVSRYEGTEKIVTIPSEHNGLPVTGLEGTAFQGNTHIIAAFIPRTLESIGYCCFKDCLHLRYIGSAVSSENLPVQSVFPTATQGIGYQAFVGTALKDIVFMAEELYLADEVFADCPFLDTVTLRNCDELMLEKGVFRDGGIRQFLAPNADVGLLPPNMFSNCPKLQTVKLGFHGVNKGAFLNCKSLTGIEPLKMTMIGENAFKGCDKLVLLKKSRKPRTPKAPIPEQAAPPAKEAPAPPPRFPLLDDSIDHNLIQEPIGVGLAPDAPILYLQLPSAGGVPIALSERMTGTFTCVSFGTYYFVVDKTPSGSSAPLELHVSYGNAMYQYMPLLNYLFDKEVSVTLRGKQEGNQYAVTDILLARSNALLPDGVLRELTHRLKHPIPDRHVSAQGAPYYMRTNIELDSFFEIMHGRLPPWVVNAYHRNKGYMRPTGTSEEKRHAQRALELLLNIDWSPKTLEIEPVDTVRKLLDQSFYGLGTVKDRICEIVAQMQRTKKIPKWGILLHGPAGCGKTSISKAIAKVLNMPLIQIDMPAVSKDPEAITGSPRIYSNARPGLILESMYSNKSSTAVLLANEIDKASNSADILLSILDKTGLVEAFLEEEIPTDNMLCIATCNDLRRVSKPLQDRFLVIDIPAYTHQDKRHIFSDYVLPTALKNANVSPDELTFSEDCVDLIVHDYATPPGVRILEQIAEKCIGDYIRRVDIEHAPAKQCYSAENIRTLLGPSRCRVHSIACRPGTVYGIFCKEGTAEIFPVEASVTPGTGKFTVLGPIPDLQKEYCAVAYFCVKNTTTCDLTKYDVTIYIPHPLPNDAANHVGAACYAAICSKLTGINIPMSNGCFVGGCDLAGNLSFEEESLMPILSAMESQSASTLYAPVGAGAVLEHQLVSTVTLVETLDAKIMFCVVSAKS